LKGLRAQIWRKRDHVQACNWIMACVILHNVALEYDDPDGRDYFVERGRESEERSTETAPPEGRTSGQQASSRREELRKELEEYQASLGMQAED
jgi:hypothetical protein